MTKLKRCHTLFAFVRQKMTASTIRHFKMKRVLEGVFTFYEFKYRIFQ